MRKSLFQKLLAFCLAAVIAVSTVNPMAAHADEGVTLVKYNGYKIFYSDDYFRHPASEYDPHLATLSMFMTDNSTPRNRPENLNDEWYEKQPNLLKGFFEVIGFEDFDTNADFKSRADFDTIGIACARRQVDDYTVIAVAVRSGGYYREWANNVWLGDGTKSDYMHEGWYNCANKLLAFLDSYIANNNITGKVKIWTAGFSRGGATANLAAGLLDNKIYREEQIFSSDVTLDHEDLYAYTFEAPQGANYNSKTVELPGSIIYDNIWNIVNPNDLVTKVAMSEYGFARFGTDKFITTKFYDPDNFTENRKTFAKLFEENGDSFENDYSGDTLIMYGIPGEKAIWLYKNLIGTYVGDPASIVGLGTDAINTYINKDCHYFMIDTRKANYDSNIVCTLFLEKLVAAIGTRDDYCKKIQDHVKNCLYIFSDDIKSNIDDFTNSAIPIAIVSVLLGIYARDNTFGLVSASDIASLLATIFSNEDLAAVADSLDPLMDVLEDVYAEIPNEFITFAKYSSNILNNHDSDVNISHLEAQDSYYIDEYNRTHDNIYLSDGPDRVSLVSLRDNADFGRLSFFGFNDCSLHLNTGNGTKRVVSVVGHIKGRSDIAQCNQGYAVGYYSYKTEEKMELFLPTTSKYIINMKSFSLKPLHTVIYEERVQFLGTRSDGRIYSQRFWIKDVYFENNVICNSKFVQRGVNLDY